MSEPATADRTEDPDAGLERETGTSSPAVPESGDIVVDAALRELAETGPDDLSASLAAGERVETTLRGRLSDLGE